MDCWLVLDWSFLYGTGRLSGQRAGAELVPHVIPPPFWQLSGLFPVLSPCHLRTYSNSLVLQFPGSAMASTTSPFGPQEGCTHRQHVEVPLLRCCKGSSASP